MVKQIKSKIISWKVESENNKKENIETRPLKITPAFAPKRPKELIADIFYIKVKKENWVVLVGLFDNEPYEMFCGKSQNIQLLNNPKKGKIKKHAKGRYSLILENGIEVKDIIASFDNAEYAWSTRFISLSLRHGVPIEIVVDQLNKDGDMTAINKVLARTLKEYIKDGTKPICHFICPDCGSENIRYESGCKGCLDCKWSKCG